MTAPSIDANTDMADGSDRSGLEGTGDGRPTPKASDPNVEGDDVDTAAIMNALRGVIDPELGDNVVDLGMVKRLERSADRAMHITIALTTAGCPLRAQLMRDAKARVASLPDIEGTVALTLAARARTSDGLRIPS